MLSFALVLIGQVIVLALLVNWWDPAGRPRSLEAARLRVTRTIRERARPRTRHHG